MKRFTLLLVLAVFIVLGTGFLVLIWMDMRNSIRSRAAQPDGSSRAAQSYKKENRRGSAPRHSPEDRSDRSDKRDPGYQEDQNSSTSCSSLGVTCATQYLAAWAWPADGSCQAVIHNSYPEPDRRCTPGGVVPGVTAETLRSPDWRTKCIRNCQSSEAQKHAAYVWYGLTVPEGNSGQGQLCELDHLVPLELGGADGMGNMWPECGPEDVTLRQRYFKQKDIVENYLAAEVRAGAMPLDEAQRGIAADWVQYLAVASAHCQGSRCQEID